MPARTMTFGKRLHLLLALLAIVPAVAVALVVGTAALDRTPSAVDARLQQGLRTALAVYESQRAEARVEAAAVAADPQLRAAIGSGRLEAFDRRAEQLVAADPELVAITFDPASGQSLVRAGVGHGVASAGLSPAPARRSPPAGGAGAMTISTTPARELANRARRLTGLHLHVARGEDPLWSTVPALRDDGAPAGAAAGPVDVDGGLRRASYSPVREPSGPPMHVGVVAAVEGAGGGPLSGDSPLLVVLLVLCLLTIAGAALAALLLRRRLDRLSAAVAALRSDDHGQQLPVESGDRFGVLAGEINALAALLAERSRQRRRVRGELEESLRRVGDAFASGLDPDAVIELATRTAVEACSAEAGRAHALDSDRMRPARVGADDGDLAEARTAAERQVFDPREAVARELAAGDGGAAARDQGLGAQTVVRGDAHGLAAPVRSRPAVPSDGFEHVGVMSIARHGRAFSDSECDLFSYLVAQAGLIVLDIDDFKRVNDEYGHPQGDAVLVEVARAVREQSRQVDSVARYGGEEIGLILPETGLHGAAELADRARRAIARRSVRRLDGGGELRVTASFGVASAPAGGTDAETLVAAADEALYRAKREGKNRVRQASQSAGTQAGETGAREDDGPAPTADRPASV